MTKATNDLTADRERHLRHAVDAARQIADIARLSAEALDVDGGFPADEIRALADQGLLAAPLPLRFGGAGLLCGPQGAAALAKVLQLLGGGSLALGRLYEGHVNALALIAAYAREEQLAYYAARVRERQSFLRLEYGARERRKDHPKQRWEAPSRWRKDICLGRGIYRVSIDNRAELGQATF